MDAATQLTMNINAVWTTLAAILVYFMHGGFGFYEAGMCRHKNTVDTLCHNLVILAITMAVYWLVGFGLMFGNGNAFIGLSGFAPGFIGDDAAHFDALAGRPVALVVAFVFAMSFADTPATLIAGTGGERIQLGAVIVMTVLISALIFPVVAHWVIGGGWLARLDTPVYDTGSGFMHLTGGCCALAVAVTLGPRRARFRHGGGERPLPPTSMPMVFLGAFILWLGFFGYNAGFAMLGDKSIALVVANTALAGGFGTVFAMATVWIHSGHPGLRPTIVGMLTANVAITAEPGIIEPWAAACIGAVAGVTTVGSMRLWARLHVDDPTEYLTMNFVGGILGMLATGVFASPAVTRYYDVVPAPAPGLVYGGTRQMVSQLIGIGAIIGFTVVAALLGCLALRAVGWLRVSPREERIGSDRSTHDEIATGEETSGEFPQQQP